MGMYVKSSGQGNQEKEDCCAGGDGDTQRTRGDRAMAFQRMLAVVFPVSNVVEKVRCARYEAKTEKGQTALQEVVGFKNAFGKNECGQHKDIFEPFARAHRLDELQHKR